MNVDTYSFTSIRNQPQKIRVIQGHLNWYQSKANVQLPISFHCNYMSIFHRFRDITIYWSKMSAFAFFYSCQSRLTLSQGFFSET